MRLKHLTVSLCLLFMVLLSFEACKNDKNMGISTPNIKLPEVVYGNLFYDVLSCDKLFGDTALFGDSKDFLDIIPIYPIATIVDDYNVKRDLLKTNDEELRKFILAHFNLATNLQVDVADEEDINKHIKELWKGLKRENNNSFQGTLIPLRHPYIVPGGRFREVYYWDSYFTMLGLKEDGEVDIIADMVDNFAGLIDEVGFIPNGNRTYYTTRSQPPFFSYMVDLLAEIKGDVVYKKYINQLIKEYEFWMNGTEELGEDFSAINRVVRLKDGAILNRYYDRLDTPRQEMYRNDIATAKAFDNYQEGALVENLYRNLRAAAESGWDFSSRWLKDGKELFTIRTTDILPIDLNCLLYHLEITIAKCYSILNKTEDSEAYEALANSRQEAINDYLWSESDGLYKDYVWTDQEQSEFISLATLFPLFEYLSSNDQASVIAHNVAERFLKAGGVVTTPIESGEQWDAPNGWAPLQWITYKGLKNYQHYELADTIKERWLNLCTNVYKKTHKLLEKYDVISLTDTGGGEYPNQDGFGWTNGVYRALSND